ncbi:beta-galactosidase-like [Dermacentor albipictus]|uniref:beta-galactosidase-like n=1 Tax=Dermacentor albipictus TaxID=60249 RepID=UPI0031FCF4C5
MAHLTALAFTVTILLGSSHRTTHRRSFTVDYANNQFLKDGQPFRFISGSLHYFRIPRAYWRDRMLKMRLAGLNALDVYVEWSGHEVEPGKFNFKGDYDLQVFLDIAKEVGLLVIFRPGPYICAERDNGGLPYWLLRLNPAMRYRSSDITYLTRVEKWFGVLLPSVERYLYRNGGPIIAVQVENEYGHYVSCDGFYMRHLVWLNQYYLGRDVVLFRTDEPNDTLYRCDEVQGPLVAADFGSDKDVDLMFRFVRRAMRHGPLVVAEYYSGWMDNWGRRHADVDQRIVVRNLETILKYNASVNFYMFHGGTNFGFTNGANPPAQPTSYDYGAPLTEAGDPTSTYFKIRETVGRYLPLPKGALPAPAPKLRLGAVSLNSCASLDEMRRFLQRQGYVKPVVSRWPLSFEVLRQAYGYVVYTVRSSFRHTSPDILRVPGIKNRGYVFTAQTRAVLSSDHSVYSAPVVVQPGENITILVENTGRVNYGPLNHDTKGIISNVTLGSHVLSGWTMEPLPLDASHVIRHLIEALGSSSVGRQCSAPSAFFGTFVLPKGEKVLDTYLNPTGWGKGAAYVNGFNLGRYWPSIGPQVTLYVPGVLLRAYPHKNTILLFETEFTPPGNRTVSFVDVAHIDGPIPGDTVRFRG